MVIRNLQCTATMSFTAATTTAHAVVALMISEFPLPLFYAGLIMLPFTWLGARLLFRGTAEERDAREMEAAGDEYEAEHDEKPARASVIYYKVYKQAVNPHHQDIYHVTLLNDRTKSMFNRTILGTQDEDSKFAIAKVIANEGKACGAPVFLVSYDAGYQEIALRQLLVDTLDLGNNEYFRFFNLRLAYFYLFDDHCDITLAEICKTHHLKDRKRKILQYKDVLNFLLEVSELDKTPADMHALADAMLAIT